MIALELLAKITGNWLQLLVYFVITWFYHVLFELLANGQSPGKKIMGLRVVRSDGSPIDPGASFLRNLLRFADAFVSLYIVGFLCAALSPGFRRLGDWAADTLVVYTRSPLKAERRTHRSWLEGLKPIAPPRALSYAEKRAILDFSRRYPLLGPARSDEIAAPYVRSLCGAEAPEGLSPSSYLLSVALLIGEARA
jgi:hypothetical protein